MAWDIYGNTLRRGYCEVHPNVHEEYPCSLCDRENQRYQPQYEQQNQYEQQPNIQFLFINQMEKTSLEKQIAARAEKRFNTEYEAFITMAKNNVIFKEMLIDNRKICGYNGYFDGVEPNKNTIEKTNFKETKAAVIAKFIEEDTKNILSKLESLNYLFNPE